MSGIERLSWTIIEAKEGWIEARHHYQHSPDEQLDSGRIDKQGDCEK